MFSKKKAAEDDSRRAMAFTLSTPSHRDGMRLVDLQNFVIKAITLGVPLDAKVEVEATKQGDGLKVVSVTTAEVPGPPDPATLWPPQNGKVEHGQYDNGQYDHQADH